MTELNAKIAALDIPARIRKLPVSPEGFPVPWFVQWYKDGSPAPFGEGVPDFRVIETPKVAQAVKRNLCWCCGEPLGQFKCFVIGPMCAINRIISEPPSHRECAEFTAKVCPFLSSPRMRRNEKDLPAQCSEAAGVHIERNPGAVCLWITKSYTPVKAWHGNDGVLFQLGDPVEVRWFAHGRPATRAEVETSIKSGYPQLVAMAELDGPEAVAALERYRKRAMMLLPEAA